MRVSWSLFSAPLTWKLLMLDLTSPFGSFGCSVMLLSTIIAASPSGAAGGPATGASDSGRTSTARAGPTLAAASASAASTSLKRF